MTNHIHPNELFIEPYPGSESTHLTQKPTSGCTKFVNEWPQSTTFIDKITIFTACIVQWNMTSKNSSCGRLCVPSRWILARAKKINFRLIDYSILANKKKTAPHSKFEYGLVTLTAVDRWKLFYFYIHEYDSEREGVEFLRNILPNMMAEGIITVFFPFSYASRFRMNGWKILKAAPKRKRTNKGETKAIKRENKT